MAKIKFGSTVVNMSGKIGGQVYSHNAAGAYLRNIGTIAVSPSAAILAARERFATVTTAWNTLTDEQRQSWGSATVNYLRKNVFADVYTMNGFNLFTSVNITRLLIGEAILLFPPFPEKPAIIEGLIFEPAGGGLDFRIDAIPSAVPADETWIIEGTPPISPQINNYKTHLAIYKIMAGGEAVPEQLLTEYEAKFGTAIVNTLGGMRVTPVHTASGTKGASQYYKYIFA
jgi:hypothetical protein